MRFHSKRIVTFGLTVCIGVLIVINVYNIDSWTQHASSPPWNRQSRLELHAEGRAVHLSPQYLDENQDLGMALDKVDVRKTAERRVLSQSNVWPNSADPDDDRIVKQMTYIPRSLMNLNESDQHGSKVILVYTGMGGWAVQPGQQTFLEQKCPVNRCFVTSNREFQETADVMLFKHGVSVPSIQRLPRQIWVLYMLESPYHTPSLSSLRNVFNWTATYRHDSTIVTPYEKFVPYNSSKVMKRNSKNYAAGKTKKVAWFVSNCGARNGRRQVANELAQYIDVDIYGACGPLKCPRFQSNDCFELLNKHYKFYLAFENSNCMDYITEKFFVNGLQNDIVPIVMGARPEDYKRAAPPHSYIHVEDFESPKLLAEYLHKLDQNDDLYNDYFRWKGTGQFINTYFWCRLCALAHDVDNSPTPFEDVEKWWRGNGVCIGQERWDAFSRRMRQLT